MGAVQTNRSERRNLEKKNLTAKDIKNLQLNERNIALKYAANGIYNCLALTMHDKWGWGQTRIKRLLDQLQDKFTAINCDFVKLDDIKKTVSEELGISID